MVNLGIPKNLDKFICVDSKTGLELHKLGFSPIYRNNNDLYFIKSKEIEMVVKEL